MDACTTTSTSSRQRNSWMRIPPAKDKSLMSRFGKLLWYPRALMRNCGWGRLETCARQCCLLALSLRAMGPSASQPLCHSSPLHPQPHHLPAAQRRCERFSSHQNEDKLRYSGVMAELAWHLAYTSLLPCTQKVQNLVSFQIYFFLFLTLVKEVLRNTI